MTTIGTLVASADGIQACNHKVGDSRILIHLQDALSNGATTCLVFTVDTDVIVIIVGTFFWKAWKSFPEVTNALLYIANNP